MWLQAVINLLTMEELHSLEISQLVDLLARYTADYTKMMTEGTTEEDYTKCDLTIKALQSEIEARKKITGITQDPKTDITTPPDFS